MLGFVVDVLTIAQLEAGRFELRQEKLDLLDIVDSMLAQFRQSETAGKHEIVLRVSGAPNPVCADRWAVEQMLVKLLSNATKFSGPGTTIRVTIAAGEVTTRLSIADQGSGISDETAAMALVPFRQVDGRLARKQGGTGLGLSIVNGLIGEHGGQLTIESGRSGGTCVSLDFPALREGGRAAPPETVEKSVRAELLAS
jgi:signal transduction histidine kinase